MSSETRPSLGCDQEPRVEKERSLEPSSTATETGTIPQSGSSQSTQEPSSSEDFRAELQQLVVPFSVIEFAHPGANFETVRDNLAFTVFENPEEQRKVHFKTKEIFDTIEYVSQLTGHVRDRRLDHPAAASANLAAEDGPLSSPGSTEGGPSSAQEPISPSEPAETAPVSYDAAEPGPISSEPAEITPIPSEPAEIPPIPSEPTETVPESTETVQIGNSIDNSTADLEELPRRGMPEFLADLAEERAIMTQLAENGGGFILFSRVIAIPPSRLVSIYGWLTVLLAAFQCGQSLDLLSLLILFWVVVGTFESTADLLPLAISRPIDGWLSYYLNPRIRVGNVAVACKPGPLRAMLMVPLMWFLLWYDLAWSGTGNLLHLWLQLPVLVLRLLGLIVTMVGVLGLCVSRSMDDGAEWLVQAITSCFPMEEEVENIGHCLSITTSFLPLFDDESFTHRVHQHFRLRLLALETARSARVHRVSQRLQNWPTRPFVPSADPHANDCPICRDPVPENEPVLSMLCGHSTFHASCLHTWFAANDGCPMCRAPAQPSPAVPVFSVNIPSVRAVS